MISRYYDARRSCVPGIGVVLERKIFLQTSKMMINTTKSPIGYLQREFNTVQLLIIVACFQKERQK